MDQAHIWGMEPLMPAVICFQSRFIYYYQDVGIENEFYHKGV